MKFAASVKKYFIGLSVLLVTAVLNSAAFCLRQIIKLQGLDPDVSPYQKHLENLKVAFEARHETAYDTEFDIKKYVKIPARTGAPKSERPTIKFGKKPTPAPLKVTEAVLAGAPIEQILKLTDELITEEKVNQRPHLKELVTKIQKAAEEAPKKTIKKRTVSSKTKKISKKPVKKVV